MSSYRTLPADCLREIIFGSGVILDVRTYAEHRHKRLALKHICLPLDELSPQAFLQKHKVQEEAIIYLLCGGGKRAGRAAEKFFADGFQNVVVIEGGIAACEACALPLEGDFRPGKNPLNGIKERFSSLSFDQKNQIFSGFCVLIGSLGVLFFSSFFIIIPFFFGILLMLSGVVGLKEFFVRFLRIKKLI